MKNKFYLTFYNLISLFIVILLFTLVDFAFHSLRLDWAVPEYYFRNKIIFASFFGLILFFTLGRIRNSFVKALIFSLIICTLLQIRYFLAGYSLNFVLIFWLIHTVILLSLSWPLFSLIKKNEEFYKHNLFKMKKLIWVIVALIIIGIVGYFVLSQPRSAPTTTPVVPAPATSPVTPAVTTEAPASSSVVTVTIKNFAFNPSTITIKKGDTVKWVNEDNVTHNITSDSGNLWTPSPTAPGQSFSFTFADSGTVSYHCSIHPSMTAKVVVN